MFLIKRSKNNTFMILAGACGILGSTLNTIIVLLAAFLSPWFSWQQNALSDLGVGEVALIFNATVFFGGILNLFFSIGLRGYLTKSNKSLIGVALLVIASISLSLVGIFTIEYSLLHSLVALSYFLLPPIALLLISSTDKDNQTKKISFIMGFLALVAILLLPLPFFVLSIQVGFAVPEIIHSLILATWTISISFKMLTSNKNSQKKH